MCILIFVGALAVRNVVGLPRLCKMGSFLAILMRVVRKSYRARHWLHHARALTTLGDG